LLDIVILSSMSHFYLEYYETELKYLTKITEFVIKEMEGFYEFKVPIVVEAESGKSWGELK